MVAVFQTAAAVFKIFDFKNNGKLGLNATHLKQQ